MIPDSKITLLINNYINDNFYVRDNDLYELQTRRLITSLTLEDHIEKIFGFNEDITYFLCYKWLMFNGKTQIAEYWHTYHEDSINTIIDIMNPSTIATFG